MQLVFARIWTRVGVSISYDGNHYTTEDHWKTFHLDGHRKAAAEYICCGNLIL